jgi:hypothetical protein
METPWGWWFGRNPRWRFSKLKGLNQFSFINESSDFEFNLHENRSILTTTANVVRGLPNIRDFIHKHPKNLIDANLTDENEELCLLQELPSITCCYQNRGFLCHLAGIHHQSSSAWTTALQKVVFSFVVHPEVDKVRVREVNIGKSSPADHMTAPVEICREKSHVVGDWTEEVVTWGCETWSMYSKPCLNQEWGCIEVETWGRWRLMEVRLYSVCAKFSLR